MNLSKDKYTRARLGGPMPQKRDEIEEEPEPGTTPPEIAEGAEVGETGTQKREDSEEGDIESSEDSHEKAHRRKRGKRRH